MLHIHIHMQICIHIYTHGPEQVPIVCSWVPTYKSVTVDPITLFFLYDAPKISAPNP